MEPGSTMRGVDVGSASAPGTIRRRDEGSSGAGMGDSLKGPKERRVAAGESRSEASLAAERGASQADRYSQYSQEMCGERQTGGGMTRRPLPGE